MARRGQLYAARPFENTAMQNENGIDLRPSKEVARALGITDDCLGSWRRAGTGPKRLTGLNANSVCSDAQAPVLRAEFTLNAREVIRAEISDLGNSKIVEVRRWYRAADGTMRPTRKGVACALRHLPALAELMNNAVGYARATGLLPTEGGANGGGTILRATDDYPVKPAILQEIDRRSAEGRP